MITPGGLTVKNIMASGVPVKRVVAGTGTGTETVWESVSKPVVAITGSLGNTSRDQFRQACIDFGTTYNTVTELPFDLDTSVAWNLSNMFDGCTTLASVPDLDTSAVKNMSRMFNNCQALTSVPDLDTSAVTNMATMFNNCRALTSIPDLDTPAVTNMATMFSDCRALTSIPDLDTSAVTNMSNMFYYCQALTDGNVRLIGRHSNVTTTNMLAYSGLTREPFYNADGTPID